MIIKNLNILRVFKIHNIKYILQLKLTQLKLCTFKVCQGFYFVRTGVFFKRIFLVKKQYSVIEDLRSYRKTSIEI